MGTASIGLDVHKRSIAVAVRKPGGGGVHEEALANESASVARWARHGA